LNVGLRLVNGAPTSWLKVALGTTETASPPCDVSVSHVAGVKRMAQISSHFLRRVSKLAERERQIPTPILTLELCARLISARGVA
jgi:hypothetical protein